MSLNETGPTYIVIERSIERAFITSLQSDIPILSDVVT